MNTWCSCDIINMKGNDEYALMESKPILHWQTPLFKIDENDGKILSDFVHNTCGWCIISPRFIEIMGDLIADCVQYLDIEIQSKDGELLGVHTLT